MPMKKKLQAKPNTARSLFARVVAPRGFRPVEKILIIGTLVILGIQLYYRNLKDSPEQIKRYMELYLDLLENAVTGSLYHDRVLWENPHISEQQFHLHQARLTGDDWPGETGVTMVGHLRIRNIKEVLLDVLETGVQGDFAEFGVWRGGACIYASGLLKIMGDNRVVHVFDAFEFLPKETGSYGQHDDYLRVTEAQVKFNYWKFGLLDRTKVQFHIGLFKDTAPKFREHLVENGKKISVLRVDGNFYDSYMDVLQNLYDLVSPGGYVIFDDIGSHPDVAQAWEDFKRARAIQVDLTRIDKHSAFFKKP